jgi:hypothetical protein
MSGRYHRAMSRLFILFLIALLPLRGWTAERMVFPAGHGMAAMAGAQHQEVADAGAMPADCALHMQTVAADLALAGNGGPSALAGNGGPSALAGNGGPSQDSVATGPVNKAGSASHSGCESCQLCMPLVALAAVQLAPVVFSPHAQPAAGTSRFASADAALSVKPPIS